MSGREEVELRAGWGESWPKREQSMEIHLLKFIYLIVSDGLVFSPFFFIVLVEQYVLMSTRMSI